MDTFYTDTVTLVDAWLHAPFHVEVELKCPRLKSILLISTLIFNYSVQNIIIRK